MSGRWTVPGKWASGQSTCSQPTVPDPNQRLRVGPARAYPNRGTKITAYFQPQYNLPTNSTQGGLHFHSSYHVSHIVAVDMLKGTSVLGQSGMSSEVKVDLGPSKGQVMCSISLKLMSWHFFLSSCEVDELLNIKFGYKTFYACTRTAHSYPSSCQKSFLERVRYVYRCVERLESDHGSRCPNNMDPLHHDFCQRGAVVTRAYWNPRCGGKTRIC